MTKALKLRTFQIGTPPKRGEGIRINTARRPPRGVKLDQLRSRCHFDSWLPSLAPSLALLARFQDALTDDDSGAVERFFASYEREMQKSEPRHTIAFLATLAQRTPISIGCYCEDESRCHRSRLRFLIERAASRNLL